MKPYLTVRRRALWVTVAPIGFALLLFNGCERERCPSDAAVRGFVDTEFIRACSSDFLSISVGSDALYPDASLQSGLGGIGGAFSANGSVEVNVHLTSLNEQPREAFHVDVYTCGGQNLVELEETGEGCERRSAGHMHCLLSVDGTASFEVSHRERGAGTVGFYSFAPKQDFEGFERFQGLSVCERVDAIGKTDDEQRLRSVGLVGDFLDVEQQLPPGTRSSVREFSITRGWTYLSRCEDEFDCSEVTAYPFHVDLLHEGSTPEFQAVDYDVRVDLREDRGSAFLSASERCVARGRPKSLVLNIEDSTTPASGYLCAPDTGFQGALRLLEGGLEQIVPVTIEPTHYATVVSDAFGGASAGNDPPKVEIRACGIGSVGEAIPLGGGGNRNFYTFNGAQIACGM